jgi:hypothetical protein
MVVAKMKADPEHAELQQTLHSLQSEIRSLSEQQKSTVHQLRQEILTLQTNTRCSPTVNNSSPVQQQLLLPVIDTQSQSLATVSCDTVLPTISEGDVESAVVSGEVTGSTHQPIMPLQQQPQTCVELSPSSPNQCSTKKIEFMAGLQLTTLSNLKDLHNKRSEHRRRHNVHSHFSYGQFEPETEVREDFCSVCRRSGELLMCDVCSLVYHLQCLDPPLSTIPVGLWSCPKCQALGKLCGGKDDWPGTLALVHSYLTHKAAREEDKQKMTKQNEELTAERKSLEEKAAQLADKLAQRLQRRNELSDACSRSRQAYKDLYNFVAIFHSPTS